MNRERSEHIGGTKDRSSPSQQLAAVGYIRTTMRMLAKSERPGADGVLKYLQQVIATDSLDVSKLIHTLEIGGDVLGLKMDMPMPERRAVLDVWPSPRVEEPEVRADLDEVQNWLMMSGQAGRITEWRCRVGIALHETCKAGWYPIFANLTFDPKVWDAEKELQDSHGPWNDYRQKMKELVRKACGFSRKVPQDQYFRYAAVIEHGKSRCHHHMHAVFMCRNLPDDCLIDPNRGNPDRDQMSIPRLLSMWGYGIRKAQQIGPLWTSDGPWRKMGWIIPTKVEILRPAGNAGQYLLKYMKKDEREWRHRIRCSRNLGLQPLKDLIEALTTRELISLTKRPPCHLTKKRILMRSGSPLSLLKRLAIFEIVSRTSRPYNCQEALIWMQSKIRGPWPIVWQLIVDTVKNGTKPNRMPSETWHALLLEALPPEQIGSSDDQATCLAVADLIRHCITGPWLDAGGHSTLSMET